MVCYLCSKDCPFLQSFSFPWSFQSLSRRIAKQEPLVSDVGIQIVGLHFHEIGATSTSASGGAPCQHNLRNSALIDGTIGSHDFFRRQFRLFTESRCFRS